MTKQELAQIIQKIREIKPAPPNNPPFACAIRLKSGIRLEGLMHQPANLDEFVQMEVAAVDLPHLSGKPPRIFWIAIDAIEVVEIG